MDEKLTNFLKFIGGQGTVLVRNIDEFDRFLKMLREHKVEPILGRPGAKTYQYWVDLAIINNKDPRTMCFEYQPGKGLSLYYDTKTPTDWYGEEPMVLAS